MGKHSDPEGVEGYEVGQHDRGGRGDSVSNDSRGEAHNGPSEAPENTPERGTVGHGDVTDFDK